MANILVVDDEKDMRLALSRVLVRYGHKVEEAEEGPSALTRVAKGGLDLILLDIRLPGMDGVQILGKIREIDPKIRVIMVTGYGSADSATEVMQLGASHYLPKPFSNKELIEVVNRVIATKSTDPEMPGILRQRLTEKVAGKTPASLATPPLPEPPRPPARRFAFTTLGLGAGLIAVLALAAHFLSGIRNADEFTIDYSHTSALAWSGNSLWTADWFSQTIHEHRFNGTKLITVRSTRLPNSHITGLTVARGTLYIVDSWKKVIEHRKLDKTLSLIGSVKSPGPKPSALFWDGQYLWSSDAGKHLFYQHDLDSDLTVLASYRSPGKTPSGMFNDKRFFWSSDADTRVLYKHRLDSQLRVVESYSLPELDRGTHALSAFAWQDDRLWFAREGVARVFRRSLSEFQKRAPN